MSEITSIPTLLSGIQCPACQSSKFKRNGKEKGNQKYQCKTCGKHYRSTTGSCIHHIHKKQHIEKYIQCISEGLTLRKAAVKTGISLKTSFIWRHKLLEALRNKCDTVLSEKTITVALQMPYSEKGTRNQTINQNNSSVQSVLNIFQTDHTGRIRISIYNSSNRYSHSMLKNLNQHSAYIAHKTLPKLFKRHCVSGNVDEQEVAVCAQDKILSWLDKFHGVATKYLHHYWTWFEQLTDCAISHNQSLILLQKCLSAH